MTTFEQIIDGVLEHEGGYVNDPYDKGGETKFGIAKRWYPDVDIKNLTKSLESFIHTQTIEKYRKRGIVVGISGGIDSAVAAALASIPKVSDH